MSVTSWKRANCPAHGEGVCSKGNGKGQDQVHPRTGHEGTEGEQRYSCTSSLTSALDGVGGQRHALAALPPGKRPGIGGCVGLRAGLDGHGKSRPHGIRSPDRPARSESLYRMSYPGPKVCIVPSIIHYLILLVLLYVTDNYRVDRLHFSALSSNILTMNSFHSLDVTFCIV